MNCWGCYAEVKEGYCLLCRKKLFGGAKIPVVLPFDGPSANTASGLQEYTKRVCISGMQLKYLAKLEDNKLQLCNENSAYILKPIPQSKHLKHVEDMPENEHLTMQIAEKIFGIRTAANALIRFKDGQSAYLTRRFDVRPEGGKYLQEDMAQIGGYTKTTHGTSYKYEGTYEEIGLLIQQFVPAAMPALERFLRLVVFNYIFSNGGAHLKNYSLMRNDAGECQLTPAYDLLNTSLHTTHEPEIALPLYRGDTETNFFQTHGYYGQESFIELATRLGIVRKRAQRIIDDFPAKQAQIYKYVENSFLSDAVKVKYLSKIAVKTARL